MSCYEEVEVFLMKNKEGVNAFISKNHQNTLNMFDIHGQEYLLSAKPAKWF